MDRRMEPVESLALHRNEIISGNLKRIRASAGMTQQDVATKLFVDRSTYSHYEGGYNVPEDFLAKFAKLFQVPLEELRKNISVGVPDTSALMKNKMLLNLMLQDFDHVMIPGTVFEELDRLKDHGKNQKMAWQALCAIQDYQSRYEERVVRFDVPGHGGGDSRIAVTVEAYRKKTKAPVLLIHDDVGLSLRGVNNMLLRDYVARRRNLADYPRLLKLDQAYENLDSLANLADSIDLNDCLPDGSTLLTHCIRSYAGSRRGKRSGEQIPPEARRRKLEFLLDHGADPNRTDNCSYCLTPLSYCVQLGDWDTFLLLLDRGADAGKGSLDERNPGYLKQTSVNESNTPLMIACWHGRRRFVRRLLREKISLNQQDSNGYTALIKCAVARYNRLRQGLPVDCQEELYQLLLQDPRTDPLIRDRWNRTAADWWKKGDRVRDRSGEEDEEDD